MKKLLFVLTAITAMLIISSCSSDSLEDTKNEKLINKTQISPSAIQDTIPLDTIPTTNDEPIDGGDPPKP